MFDHTTFPSVSYAPEWFVFARYALATTGLAIFARALPWPKSWLDRKPLACPACMSGWAGILVLAVSPEPMTLDTFALWFACIGVSAPLFKGVYPPSIELP